MRNSKEKELQSAKAIFIQCWNLHIIVFYNINLLTVFKLYLLESKNQELISELTCQGGEFHSSDF